MIFARPADHHFNPAGRPGGVFLLYIDRISLAAQKAQFCAGKWLVLLESESRRVVHLQMFRGLFPARMGRLGWFSTKPKRLQSGSRTRRRACRVIGHADRAGPLRDYCTGLLLPGERKSVEPMAALTAPARTAAQHQSLLHFVGQAPWSDAAVLTKVRELVLPHLERHGPIAAWIIDDTGIPKKRSHSVGVQHQYCGQLGKQANCQVAVGLSLANHHGSLPVAFQLWLPKVSWADDAARRRKAGVPAVAGAGSPGRGHAPLSTNSSRAVARTSFHGGTCPSNTMSTTVA